MLIQLPQGYEPCALPLRHAGEEVLVAVFNVESERRSASDHPSSAGGLSGGSIKQPK